MAYGGIVDHLFGASAGQPALYAVVAMGAVFTSAARAPLTSLASVVEMTGDFSLTLPVMLAVAIASAVSRALSYGTIYTTKLLRRGTDIDQAAPWRALADLKITDVMRPFTPALPVPPDTRSAQTAGQDGAGGRPDETAPAGPVTERHDVQTLFASESLGQALRQLAVYGRDGLPVVSADERELEGWVTSAGVLRALAHRIAGTAAETAHAQAAADGEPDDTRAMLEHPSVPLPGYYVAEITINGNSPAAGQKLSDVSWPPSSNPVAVLRGGSLRQPDPGITLVPGDRVSLLIPAGQDTRPSDTGPRDAVPAGRPARTRLRRATRQPQAPRRHRDPDPARPAAVPASSRTPRHPAVTGNDIPMPQGSARPGDTGWMSTGATASPLAGGGLPAGLRSSRHR
jgi:CIC family chloride channel protein